MQALLQENDRGCDFPNHQDGFPSKRRRL